jgi:hypothetical protein
VAILYSLRSAVSKPLDSKCAQAVNPDIVKHWFDLVKEHTKIGQGTSTRVKYVPKKPAHPKKANIEKEVDRDDNSRV